MQDGCDFYGYERVGSEFKVHRQPKTIPTSQTSLIGHHNQTVSTVPVASLSSSANSQSGTVELANTHVLCSGNLSRPIADSDSLEQVDNRVDSAVLPKQSPAKSVLNSERNESRLARKLLEKAKSPKKFVLPPKSVHSSRPIIPNKRFLQNMEAVRRKGEKCSGKSQEIPCKPYYKRLKRSVNETDANSHGKRFFVLVLPATVWP